MALLFSRTSSGSVINLLFTYNRNIPSTDILAILAHPIDSLANIVDSIKEDKIAKRAKFCIRLRAARFYLACLPDLLIHVRIDCSQPLCLHTRQKKKASEGIAKYARGGRVSRFYSRIQRSHKNTRKQRAVNSLRPKVIEKYFRMTLRLHCSASLNNKSDFQIS